MISERLTSFNKLISETRKKKISLLKWRGLTPTYLPKDTSHIPQEFVKEKKIYSE